MTRRKKIVLGLILAKTFLLGSSPFLYLSLLFGPNAQFVSIDPRPEPTTPGPKIGGFYAIVDQAPLDPLDRLAVAAALFLGDLRCHGSDEMSHPSDHVDLNRRRQGCG